MNRLNPILLTVILLSAAHGAFSQGIWKTYTTADGLAGNSIFCIAQDKIGNLWFGTQYNGISMLDTNGVIANFMSTDSSVYIIDIEIDILNNKWFALYQHGVTYYGTYIVKFDDSSYTYFEPTGSPIYDPKPCCLGQDSLGNIWSGGTRFGISYWFDGTDWHEYYVPGTELYSSVNEIVTDRYGKLYFAHDRGIATFYEYLFWGWMTLDIAFDKQNRMWCAPNSWMWGLAMFDGENWYAHTEDDGLLKTALWAVAVDSSNNVWLSYFDTLGVSKFDGNKFTHFKKINGLADNLVWDIFVDKNGYIWFATDGGISVLYDTTTTRVQQKSTQNIANFFPLFQNYPNPFNSLTTISYCLITEEKVQLTIYNLIGKEVITLVNERKTRGLHKTQWYGKDYFGKEVSSGIYIAVLKSIDFKKSIKLSLIR